MGVFGGLARGRSTAKEIQTVDDFNNPGYCAPSGTSGVPSGKYWCNVNGAANYASSPVTSFNTIGDTWGMQLKGAVAGFTVGYNKQDGSIVYGVEADIGALTAKGKSGPSPASRDDTYLHTAASDFSTARVRFGFAFDRMLVYGTAGAALAQFNSYVDDPDMPIWIMTQRTSTQFGYVVGLGAEYALTRNISIKADVLNMGFAGTDSLGYVNVTCTASCPPQWKLDRLGMAGDGTAGWRISHTMNVVRAGVNYKF